MRTIMIKIFCDRCDREINTDNSGIRLKIKGPLDSNVRFDLCKDCSEQFKKFMSQNPIRFFEEKDFQGDKDILNHTGPMYNNHGIERTTFGVK